MLCQEMNIKTVVENSPVVQSSNIVFVSVKPQTVTQVLRDVKQFSQNKLFISVAMGVTIKALEEVSYHFKIYVTTIIMIHNILNSEDIPEYIL